MAEDAPNVPLLAAAVAIALGLALVAGALASRAWMRGRSSAWRDRVLAQAARTCRLGFALGGAGLLAALWLGSAAMSGVPVREAGPAVGRVLRHTHFGLAWLTGLAAWLAAAACLAPERDAGRGRAAGLVALAVFVATRSVVSHAGAQGDASLDVLVDMLHVAFACCWVGIVLVGARLELPPPAASASERGDAAHWVASMSTSATVALCGVVATGTFKAWRALAPAASLAHAFDSGYGHALAAKLVLVALAAMLGGLDRFAVLPALARELAAGRPDDDARWRRRLVAILRVEALVLILVVVAAAALGSAEPPS
jgi:putative copper resistance protein D